MEDEKDNSPAQLSRSKQPVKTEWGAQYVVFTYFQGDINSEVDEHFSRALSATKIPQDLSRKAGGEVDVVKNETHVRPHGWTFSPHWAKPYPTPLPLNLSGSVENAAAPPGVDTCPTSVLQGVPTTVAELWHMSSGSNPNLAAGSGYPPSVPDPHMGQGLPVPDGKYRGSLLGLLRHESCPGSAQEPSTSGSACLSGSGMPTNDRRRDVFF